MYIIVHYYIIDANKIVRLYQNCAKTNIVVKLCVGDYLTYDGFVNGADGLF
jgi:hypothetical protein